MRELKMNEKYILLCVVCIAYVASFFLVPFSDWDTIFYSFIGKGVIKYHILPYNYVFDHKPYLGYVLYYIWDSIIPFKNGKFTYLSILSIFLICTMGSKFYKIRITNLATNIFFASVIANFFTGNTESIQIPIIFLAIISLTKGIESRLGILYCISGVLMAFVASINYLSSFLFFPIIIYAFFYLPNNKKYITYLCLSGVGATCVILMPFWIHGTAPLITYFSMQQHFLHNYGASFKERLDTLQEIIFKVSLFYIPVYVWFKNTTMSWGTIRSKILTLWFLSSLGAAALSGHNYDHYAALFFVPGMMICSIILQESSSVINWKLLPIYLLSLGLMVGAIRGNINHRSRLERTHPEYVSNLVKDEKVLNIRADQSLFYLAHLQPFDRFLFRDQLDIYFAGNAVQEYMNDLEKKPKFVLLPYRACPNKSVDDRICQWLNTRYHIIYSAYNHKRPKSDAGEYYDLYKINE